MVKFLAAIAALFLHNIFGMIEIDSFLRKNGACRSVSEEPKQRKRQRKRAFYDEDLDQG